MKRVLVLGSGGAGKSTFARQLGGVLSLPVIHLDAMYWRPGWMEPTKAEWRDIVERIVADEIWILDGNYSGTFDLRADRADTIIFLDLPRMVCLWRVLRRTAVHYGTARPDMATGCHERFDLPFLRWIWNYPRRTRPKVLQLLMAHSATTRIVHLRSAHAAKVFLASLRPAEMGRVRLDG